MKRFLSPVNSSPTRFSLLSRHRIARLVRNQQLSEVDARVTPMHEISEPLLLLEIDDRSERDPVRRINEAEHKDFAVAGLLWVDKSERLDLDW